MWNGWMNSSWCYVDLSLFADSYFYEYKFSLSAQHLGPHESCAYRKSFCGLPFVDGAIYLFVVRRLPIACGNKNWRKIPIHELICIDKWVVKSHHLPFASIKYPHMYYIHLECKSELISIFTWELREFLGIFLTLPSLDNHISYVLNEIEQMLSLLIWLFAFSYAFVIYACCMRIIGNLIELIDEYEKENSQSHRKGTGFIWSAFLHPSCYSNHSMCNVGSAINSFHYEQIITTFTSIHRICRA